jgi:PBSX family phage terminase large subunit
MLVTLNYSPFEHQKEMHLDNHRFKVIKGGRRSGKSASALQECIKRALSLPNQLIWWVSPTYREAREIGYETFNEFSEALKPAIISTHESILRIIFTNGSKIYFKGADRIDSLRGRGLDFLVIDEAAFVPRDTWKKVLRPTLSDKNGSALLISTPNGRNWFYELYTSISKDSSWISFSWPSTMNPLITEDELNQARIELSDIDFRQEYLSEFITKSGQVYQDFNENNIIEEFTVDTDKYDIYIGADFGYANPTALLFFAVNPLDGRVYLFDEIYKERYSIEKLKELIIQTLAKHNIKKRFVKAIYTDPAGNAEEITSGISPVDYLRQDFQVINKGSKIAPGLALVRSFIKNSLGDRKLLIHNRCKETIRSLYGYTYEQSSRYKEHVIDEEPFKDGLNDHAADALRYFFVNVFSSDKWISGVIKQTKYTDQVSKVRVMKLCSRCHRPFVSNTPKNTAPFLCLNCLSEKENNV